MIRRLLMFFVLVIVAVLVGVDFGVKYLAEKAVANQAKHSTGAASASASISGFPFLYDTLVKGRVQGVDVHLSNVPAGASGLFLQTVTVDLTGVSLNRQHLVSHGKVNVTGITQGTGTIDVSAPELSAVAQHTITVGPQASDGSYPLLVDLGAGRTVTATATITAGHVLLVSAGGVPLLQVDLGRTPVVQDCSMSLRVTPGGVEAACTMSPVPPAVIAAVSS